MSATRYAKRRTTSASRRTSRKVVRVAFGLASSLRLANVRPDEEPDRCWDDGEPKVPAPGEAKDGVHEQVGEGREEIACGISLLQEP
jgi:hypothetical protein